MIKVDILRKGIVIDHIKAGYGYKIFTELGLDKSKDIVVLIKNVPSKKLGRKDLIKIENNIDIDFTMIGLIDPGVSVNIIENETIKRKVKLTLPDKVVGILKCKNPRCITSVENVEDVEFYLVDPKKREYRCEYCDTTTSLLKK